MSTADKLFFRNRSESIKDKLEQLTMEEIREICKKYGCTVYAKSKDKLIQKLLEELRKTRNITDDTLFDLRAAPSHPLRESFPSPTFSTNVEEVPKVCHIRLDEDYNKRICYPKGKTKEDLVKLLENFFNDV